MWFQAPRQGHGHLPQHQVDCDPIRPSLEYLQGWSINNFYGQLVPVPHYSLGWITTYICLFNNEIENYNLFLFYAISMSFYMHETRRIEMHQQMN